MPKQVYKSESYSLEDGTEIVLKPLPIGRLKKFMKQWEGLQKPKGEELTNDEAFDVYIAVTGVALSRQFDERFEKNMNEEGELSEEYREYLEDVIDVETAMKVIEICGGIDLSAPKLEDLVEAMQNQETDGKN